MELEGPGKEYLEQARVKTGHGIAESQSRLPKEVSHRSQGSPGKGGVAVLGTPPAVG